ncbi:MAG TPA: NADH-ubiquinone oxidoreductase-F iron-sulfur binding region domain-containing protein, partial [Pseudonocardiaceae bacterium]
RGLPRNKPPFPAVAGVYALPTNVNNVESIAVVPSIVLNGADWFGDLGTEKSKGFGIFNLSGHISTPGTYESPLGITLRELLELSGGIRGGRRLKFWTAGGSSAGILTDQHIDVPLDFESVAAAGSQLGTRSVQIFDDTTCVVGAVLRWTQFYQHESCGKCTPCREGTFWLVRILDRLEHGDGTEEDVEKLLDICDNINGRAFCALGDSATPPITSAVVALGDSATPPITSAVRYFTDEFIQHLKEGGCPFDPAASTVWAEGLEGSSPRGQAGSET